MCVKKNSKNSLNILGTFFVVKRFLTLFFFCLFSRLFCLFCSPDREKESFPPFFLAGISATYSGVEKHRTKNYLFVENPPSPSQTILLPRHNHFLKKKEFFNLQKNPLTETLGCPFNSKKTFLELLIKRVLNSNNNKKKTAKSWKRRTNWERGERGVFIFNSLLFFFVIHA